MTCEICGNKPMNCDCTKFEKAAYSELGELTTRIEELEAEVERLKSFEPKYSVGDEIWILFPGGGPKNRKLYPYKHKILSVFEPTYKIDWELDEGYAKLQQSLLYPTKELAEQESDRYANEQAEKAKEK